MLAKNYDGPVLSVDKGGNDVFTPVGVLKSCTVTIRSSALQIITLHHGSTWPSAINRGNIEMVTGPLYYFDADDHAVLDAYRAHEIVMDWKIQFPDLGWVSGLYRISGLEPVTSTPAVVAADIALEACSPARWPAESPVPVRSLPEDY